MFTLEMARARLYDLQREAEDSHRRTDALRRCTMTPLNRLVRRARIGR